MIKRIPNLRWWPPTVFAIITFAVLLVFPLRVVRVVREDSGLLFSTRDFHIANSEVRRSLPHS